VSWRIFLIVEALSMKTLSFAVLAALLLCPAAEAAVTGLTLEAGPVFLTKAGKIKTISTKDIESDAGVAFRGLARLGLGPASVALEAQTSSQKYKDSNATDVPNNLNASYVGLLGAVHPITILGISPYIELGFGKLSFSDSLITHDGGVKATTYGLGALFRPTQRIGIDLDLRILQQGDLMTEGSVEKFKYDPKLFSAMVTYALQ
jgi:hypothetical protein